MSTSSFSIDTMSQDIHIDAKNIEARYDGLNASLRIFLGLTLRPQEQLNTSLDFICIYSDLHFSNSRIQISQCSTPFAESLHEKERKTGVWLSFPLSDKTLHTIQKQRAGNDVQFIIDFRIVALRKETQSHPGSYMIWNATGTREFQGSIAFSISKSHWVENFLPRFGYDSFRMIEIPIKHKHLKEAYNDIIREFDLAQQYFEKDDNNKCVSHCRSTLDQLTRNLKKIKEGQQSESAFQWLKNIDGATFKWINEIDKSLSAIGSKAHHAGLKKDFSRVEAESIYLVTLGLMNFIGQASQEYNE